MSSSGFLFELVLQLQRAVLRCKGDAMRLRRLITRCESAAAHSSRGRCCCGVCLRAGAALLAVAVLVPLLAGNACFGQAGPQRRHLPLQRLQLAARRLQLRLQPAHLSVTIHEGGPCLRKLSQQHPQARCRQLHVRVR
jgi:hypothetical protein